MTFFALLSGAADQQAISTVPSFDPTTIAGLVCWYDASDSLSFTYSSGVVVSQWNDKSGNSRHMTQATVGNQPSRSGTQNGLTTVVFDGTDDYMTYDAGSDAIDITPWTWFAVVRDAGGATGDRIMTSRREAVGQADFEAGGAIFGYRAAGPSLGAFGGGATPTNRSFTGGAWFLARSTVDAGTIQVAVNSTTAASTTGAAPPNQRFLRLGAGSGSAGGTPAAFTGEVWVGQMAEILLWNAALSGTDITTVETYLRAKWGTP